MKSYFISLPSDSVRAQFFDPEKFKLKVWQAQSRDASTLEVSFFKLKRPQKLKGHKNNFCFSQI